MNSENIVPKHMNNYKEDTTRGESKGIKLFLVVETAEKV